MMKSAMLTDDLVDYIILINMLTRNRKKGRKLCLIKLKGRMKVRTPDLNLPECITNFRLINPLFD